MRARYSLFITASVERGTRWLMFEQNAPAAWKRAQEQVEAFLESLDAQGAFAGSMPEESYFVICDERVHEARTIEEGKVKVLFGVAITKPGDFHAWLITHQPGGVSTCRPSHPNRAATSAWSNRHGAMKTTATIFCAWIKRSARSPGRSRYHWQSSASSAIWPSLRK